MNDSITVTFSKKTLLFIGIGASLILLGAISAWYFLIHTTPAALAPSTSHIQLPDGELKETGVYHDINAVYPGSTPILASAGQTANDTAVTLMKTFEEKEIARFKSDSNIENLTPEDIKIQGLGDDRKYELDIMYEMHTSPTTVSYIYTIYADTLGAHPNAYYRTFTFDLKTGKQLELADLFTGSYLGTLSTLAARQLPAIVAAKENTPVSEVDRDQITAGIAPEPEAFQFFYVEAKKLVIVFPPYQIGPWALGTILLPIDTSELPTLKAEYK